MKKSDKISYHQKDPSEIAKILSSLPQKIIEAKAKQQLGNLKDTSVFKKLRYEIALAKSLLSLPHEPRPVK